MVGGRGVRDYDYVFFVMTFIITVHSSSSNALLYPSKIILPNTTGISGELTSNMSVDHFFSLWIVFNNEDISISDKLFTILAPRNNASMAVTHEKANSHAQLVRKLLLDHIILGQKLDLHIQADLSVTALGGRTVNIRRHNGVLHANGAKVVEEQVDVMNGRLVIIDNLLFPEDITDDHSFLQDMTEVLSFLQSGVRVFQHLLARSNVTRLLTQGESYTVLVPTDIAFQKWHPIDYGFYPFSVPEFTESVLTNHFIKGNIRQEGLTDEHSFKTLDGKEVVFRRRGAVLTANGVEVIKGDTPVAKGNIMFVSDVLFVNDNIVQRLNEKHKDKETPPLISSPWPHSQFLSLAYRELLSMPDLKHITRLLYIANISPLVPGVGYTFFVPNDKAIENLKVNAKNFGSNVATDLLLRHIVKGRLYKRDLQNGVKLVTLANTTVNVQKTGEKIFIGNASIVQSDLFIYNTGIIFIIDDVLNANDSWNNVEDESTTLDSDTTTTMTEQTTITDIEEIPDELTDETGTYHDILLEEESHTTSNNV